MLPLIVFFMLSCEGDKNGPITPSNVAVTAISISLPSGFGECIVGNTVQLTVTITPSNATDKTVSWSSSNSSIATVSPAGLVTAIAAGSVDITATCGGKRAVIKITVKKLVAVTSISLSETNVTLKSGASKTITATIIPTDATNKIVTWSSSNNSVATITNGTIKAVGVGKAVITAKCGDKSATCNVTVLKDGNIGDRDGREI